MAYKFQVGSATMSGSLVQEGEIKIQNESAVEHAKLTQAGVVSGSGQAAFGSIKLGGTAVTATAAELNYLDNSDLTAADITKLAALTATAAEINYLDNSDLTAADITKLAALTATAAEINYLDNDALTAADITKLAAIDASATELNYLDLTNAIGTVAASEAVVLDANKDASGFRNLGAAQLTTSGRVIVDDATEATSTTDGSLQTDGGLSVAKSVVIGDDLDLLSDGAILNIGSTSKFTLTDQASNNTVMAASGARLAFGNAGEYISGDGTDLKIVSSGDVDITGDVDVVGSMSCDTSFTLDAVTVNATELGFVDGVTAGTAAASKALVLDASRDIGTVRKLTLDGLLSSSAEISGSVFWGSGAGLTGISSDTVDTTTDSTSATYYVPFVDQATGADGETLRIHSAVAINPSTGVFTIAGSAPSIGIGSAVLTESEMEMLDGITAGTVAASKAVVVDASKDISGLRNVTATGYFEIGSAQLTESEMEMLDGITAGTVAASKAVVVDSNKDISGLRNVTATGAFIIGSANLNEADMEQIDGITAGTAAASKAVVLNASKDITGLNDVSAAGLTLSDLTSGRLPLVSTSGLLADNAQISYDVGRNFNGYNNIAVSSSVSGSGYLGDGLLYVGDASADDILFASKDGVGMGYDSTLQSGEGDNVFFFGPSDGEIKLQYDGTAVYFGKDSDVELQHVADTGLRLMSSRQLQFGDAGTYIHQSADGVLDLVADSEIEINATTIDVNGILDVSGNSTLGGTLTAASLGSATVDLTADLMVIDDGAAGAIKTTSLANYATALAAGSNEGLKSTAGRLQVDLDDLAAAAVSVANDSIAIIDADGSNASKKESIADLVAAMAGAGLTATNGVLSSDASPTPTDHGDAAGTLVEGLNFSDTAFTAARSWTLPASPDLGDKIIVKAPTNAGTYNLTIVKAGSQQIDGVAQDLLIESDSGAVTLVYAKADRWVIS